MITVKNVSSAKIYLSLPNVHFSRELLPGREIPISEEVYREMSFDTGCIGLIDGHFIKISGLDAGEQVTEVSNVYDVAAIAKMLEGNDMTAFARFISGATAAEKDTVVRIAVDKGITTPGIVTLIKKYCDVDIINAISIKHQAEEK